jgi:putative transposon-encoded protein
MLKHCTYYGVDRHEIEGHEVIEGEVKPTGNGAHVLVPKDWRGADVKIVRATEPDK